MEPYLDPDHTPLWLVVAFQILLDIRTTLGRYHPTALNDLKEYADEMNCVFRKNVRHVTELAEKTGPTVPSWTSRLVRSINKCMQLDNFTTHLKKELKWKSKDDAMCHHQTIMGLADFYLLKTNMLLCGMQSWWMEDIHLSFTDATIQLHESIMPAALLYIQMRQDKLVGAWRDMDFVISTRAYEMSLCRKNSWKMDIYPDVNMLFEAFRFHFEHADKPCDRRMHSLNPRYVSNLFTWYDRRISETTMRMLVDRYVEVDRVNGPLEDAMCRNKAHNLLRSLEVVKITRYMQEELASFDWFNMYDTCQKFFDSLRETLRQSFSAFESKSPSRSCPTTGPSSLDENSGSGLSRTLPLERNHLSYTSPTTNPSSVGEDSDSCSSHTVQMEDDDSSSLDALYYLVFADDPQRGQANMILAALCFNPLYMSNYTIPNREYMIERWGNGIVRHAHKLGVSLTSAADVLQRVVLQNGGHDENVRGSGAWLWKRQRLRAAKPEGPFGECSYMRNARWCYGGAHLYRTGAESYTLQGWDRYHEFVKPFEHELQGDYRNPKWWLRQSENVETDNREETRSSSDEGEEYEKEDAG
ncbi:hypothetical protein F4803DRAFT_575679 [Xylaria telfairii]|nr:hypothetical protein F4803DRAFT_575679 [Xylaria telfairii]